PGTAAIMDLLFSDSLVDVVNIPPVEPIVNAASFPDQFRSIRLLHKLFQLIKAWKLDAVSTQWILKNSSALGWMQPDGIPYEAGQAPVAYAAWEDFLGILKLGKELTPVDNPAD